MDKKNQLTNEIVNDYANKIINYINSTLNIELDYITMENDVIIKECIECVKNKYIHEILNQKKFKNIKKINAHGYCQTRLIGAR